MGHLPHDVWPTVRSSGLVLLLTTTLALSAEAGSTLLQQSLQREATAARRAAGQVGIEVLDLEADEVIFSANAHTPYIIASNTKLFTTAAALDRLGPGFFFETPLLLRGEVADGVLAGDLAVVGGGDPNLSGRLHNGDSLRPFREWGAALKRLGIDRITRDLVLVEGFFDTTMIHPDWPRDQLDSWYEAPVTALSFNDNCVLVQVRPGARAGRLGDVEVVPPLPYFRVENNVVTTLDAKQHSVWIDRQLNPDGEGEVLIIGGKIFRHTEVVEKWLPVGDPVRYFGAAVAQGLREAGVVVEGQIRPVTSLEGPGWRQLGTYRSDLLTTLEVINKRSQNFYAESLFKTLGARLCGEGTWSQGRQAVEEFLTEIGVAAGTYQLADGSGMSRNNRFSAHQLILLLRHMFTHRWGAEFLASLPYSGEPDLRWEKRLATPPYRGNVLAKTGSLSGVSTLSGYAKARSGKVYAFSILCNKANGGARLTQDRILRALIDHG